MNLVENWVDHAADFLAEKDGATVKLIKNSSCHLRDLNLKQCRLIFSDIRSGTNYSVSNETKQNE